MSEINKELIESFRKIVLPFVSNRLYKTNFEEQGETDKAEFEHDFNEILDLAISALNPTGDLISREALKDEVIKHAEYYADRTKEDRYNVGYTECACEILDFIDNAPPVKFSLLPADESKEEAYMRGYEHGKIEGIIKGMAYRPKGKWVDTGDKAEYWSEEYQCSICGAKDHWHNYCPSCGADMRGKENEESD